MLASLPIDPIRMKEDSKGAQCSGVKKTMKGKDER